MDDVLYKRDKTKADIDVLLEQHKNLIYYMLKNMGQLQSQNAESAAWEALWDAAMTFDVYSNTAFCTYACTLIKNAINNELRKQMALKNAQCISVDALEIAERYGVNDEVCTVDSVARIYKLFDEYLMHTSGVSRAVLMYWRSSGFDIPVSTIAAACNTSTSYVSRVQCGFRAFLSGKLKGE